MSNPLELKLQKIVNHHVGAEIRTRGPLEEQPVHLTMEPSPATRQIFGFVCFIFETKYQLIYSPGCLSWDSLCNGARLKLTEIQLPLPPVSWDERCAPPHTV